MNWQQACELPYYGGSDLGANPAAEETVFKLWAPTACGVVVCLYATGTDAEPGAGLGIGAGCIQADYDPAGRGCPQLENRFLRRRICTEVAAAVIGQFTRLLPVHG